MRLITSVSVASSLETVEGSRRASWGHSKRLERANLRHQRQLRGWSEERAASELADLAQRKGLARPGADGKTFSRWERGVTTPRPFYASLLCELYARSAAELDLADWDAVLRVNLTSMMLMAGQVVPLMAARGGGSIVNISSTAGLIGGSPLLAYSVSKSAVIGLTRTLAFQHGRQGIRVNAVAPGYSRRRWRWRVSAATIRRSGRPAGNRRCCRPWEQAGTWGTRCSTWLRTRRAG